MQQCYGIAVSDFEPVYEAKLHMHALIIKGCHSGRCSTCNAAHGVLTVLSLSSLTGSSACMQQLSMSISIQSASDKHCSMTVTGLTCQGCRCGLAPLARRGNAAAVTPALSHEREHSQREPYNGFWEHDTPEEAHNSPSATLYLLLPLRRLVGAGVL